MEECISFFKRNKILLLFWFGALILAHKMRFVFLLGGYRAHLSGLAFVLPSLGFFLTGRSSLFCGGGVWLLTRFVTSLSITFGLPTFLATLSWNLSGKGRSFPSFLLHVLLPSACMFLFCRTPAGRGAWAYSLYWCIPAALYAAGCSGMWARALQSTFIAHAAGSILWLYFVPMTSEQWLSLVPVVAFERAALALSGIGFILGLRKITGVFSASKAAKKNFLHIFGKRSV